MAAEKLRIYTLRLPPPMISTITKLAAELDGHPLVEGHGRVTAQSVARLALARGFASLRADLDGRDSAQGPGDPVQTVIPGCEPEAAQRGPERGEPTVASTTLTIRTAPETLADLEDLAGRLADSPLAATLAGRPTRSRAADLALRRGIEALRVELDGAPSGLGMGHVTAQSVARLALDNGFATLRAERAGRSAEQPAPFADPVELAKSPDKRDGKAVVQARRNRFGVQNAIDGAALGARFAALEARFVALAAELGWQEQRKAQDIPPCEQCGQPAIRSGRGDNGPVNSGPISRGPLRGRVLCKACYRVARREILR